MGCGRTYIEMLRKEIESREICQMMTNKVKTLDKRSEKNTDDFTASALLTDSSNLSCTYCKRNHSSSKCTVITDIKARRAFVRNKGRCYVCLKSGHLARSCQSTNKCFKCGGRHHISLCEPRKKPDEQVDQAEYMLFLLFVHLFSNQFIELAQVQYEHLIELKLADSTDGESNLKVDILIGGDNYWKFVTGKVVRGRSGPVALETIMGWVLSGSMDGIGCDCNSTSSNVVASSHVLKVSVEESDMLHGAVVEENSDFDLNEGVKKFWNLESLGILGEENSDEVYDKFNKDIAFDGDRYTVKLPWKTDNKVLPDNFKLSQGRLNSLIKRLRKTPQRLKEYDEIIRKQEEEGIVETVDCLDVPNKPGSVHYIPHREVIREDKDTTKLRIVYDASARNDGPSLNDCLETGPCLLPKIFDILTRFRTYKYALTSDIKSAFLNIRVDPEDRDFLRFL